MDLARILNVGSWILDKLVQNVGCTAVGPRIYVIRSKEEKTKAKNESEKNVTLTRETRMEHIHVPYKGRIASETIDITQQRKAVNGRSGKSQPRCTIQLR